MEERQFFLFSNWRPEHIRIACQLVPYLCRHRAGLYGVDFPKYREGHPTDQTVQEVRVGWPNPDSPNKHILSILQPRADGLLWELRLSPKSGFISPSGPLRLLKLEKGKEHQESQKAKGCIILTEPTLPLGFEAWIDAAFAYTIPLYGIE